MKKIIKKSKDAVYYAIPPQSMALIVLTILFWGAQVALAGFVIVKVVHAING